jgi:transposase
VSDRRDPIPLPDGLDIASADWQQTPLSVRRGMRTLLTRLDTLEARLHQDSSNSSRPPSTDAPEKKRQRRTTAANRRKPGAQPGHPGHPQVLLDPPIPVSGFPQACPCGHPGLVELTPYHPPQVIELPVMRPEVPHWLLHQGRCLSCGTPCKASLPAEHTSGDGPRLTGFVGELAGIVGARRSAGHDLCASVFSRALSKGAIQKLVERGAEAIVPHDTAIGEVARPSLVHAIAATSWLTHGDRPWLWVMANPAVAYLQRHPNRSKAAFGQRIGDWTGLLGSDGDGVYQSWAGLRQSGLAHLLRTAKGLAERVAVGMGRFGRLVHAELQRWCHMGTERPTVGQWRAWYARFRSLITQSPPERTRRGRLPVVWYGKGRHGGHFWRCRGWNPRIMWLSAPIGLGYCGASGAKGRAVRRAIAGWNGCSHCDTPVASEDNQPFRCWSMRVQACSQARGLISAGFHSMSPCQCPLPRDQIRLKGVQWRHGPPQNTPCRLRYPLSLGLVAQVPT